jgi:predicted secreted protein with PEFG-CTERM motif
VTYRITAYDHAGNQMTENNDRSYVVVPEFQTLTILALASAITTLIAAIRKKNDSKHQQCLINVET